MGYSLRIEKNEYVKLVDFDFSMNFYAMQTLCALLPSFGKLKNEVYKINSNAGYGIPFTELYEIKDKLVAEAESLTFEGVLEWLKKRDGKEKVRYHHLKELDNQEAGAYAWLNNADEWARKMKIACEAAKKREDFEEIELRFY